ncbi:cache domain-containing sensor histidine kinase [Evansella tamaricis]|uniref:Sensor histidine kinase n=1 Tax=Evansella tamaricis TaxID=2069301 RepID=A0ABS6JJE9_9BACI|nr:sensor histidine kinase [Evansella tamaricis]MBU9712580.1 sensor histidine kinase [Evansella tamaricis]
MKKWFEINNLPIRYKLIIHFLLVSILPALALAIMIGWAVDKIIEEQVNENTIQLIDKVNSSLEYYIENVQNLSYFISFDSHISDFLSGELLLEEMEPDEEYEVSQFLLRMTTIYPEVAGIMVINKDGDYISNELYSRTSQKLTNEIWYREAVENQGIAKIIGNPVGRNIASHVNYQEEEIISVARSIIDPISQEEKGVILIDLKVRVIGETVKDVRLGKTGYLMVVDDHGNRIYSPNQNMLNEIPVEEISTNNSGTFSKKINGEQIQFIYRKSPFTNWTTVGVFSAEQSIAAVQQIQFYVISFLFFVCLIGITASYYLSYSMSRPISRLVGEMQRAESGDFSSNYKDTRMDEVGRLGRSFNSMVSKINNLLMLTEKQERQKREAELHSLQAHIKPHFLYNTLDTIQWMARKKGASDVADLVGSLSRLFRIGLSKGDTIIPLREEIQHIESYLKIQTTRYQEKLNYSIDVSPEVEDFSILKIVLQPIVENAIYHGIKERRGPGHISIVAKKHRNNLVIQIQDDGKGMTNEKLEELKDSLASFFTKDDDVQSMGATKGYGIVNVHARLKLTFGEDYGVKMESELDKGTLVTIYHPLLKGNIIVDKEKER